MRRPNPAYDDRSALANANHPRSYDPSGPLRARMQPPPPQPDYSMSDPNANNPVPPQGGPFANNGPSGGANRIPQYFYPRYNEPPDSYGNDPYGNRQPPFVDPRYPYAQPIPLSMDSYENDPYSPYPAPYLVPLTSNVHVDPAPPSHPPPPTQEQVKSDILASHKKDADLSRLEVYHFTPKQNNTTAPAGAPSTQPIVQYHVYPYPPGGPAPAAQQAAPYTQSWYGNPADPYAPMVERKARGMQTDALDTKTRALSPMYAMEMNPRQEQRTSTAQHVVAYTDRYDPPAPRPHGRSHERLGSKALNDCRCLDCRSEREREKVLNYYPEWRKGNAKWPWFFSLHSHFISTWLPSKIRRIFTNRCCSHSRRGLSKDPPAMHVVEERHVLSRLTHLTWLRLFFSPPSEEISWDSEHNEPQHLRTFSRSIDERRQRVGRLTVGSYSYGGENMRLPPENVSSWWRRFLVAIQHCTSINQSRFSTGHHILFVNLRLERGRRKALPFLIIAREENIVGFRSLSLANMQSQLIVVLLTGLVAATYALDLSHANPAPSEIEPRIFNFINDFYAQVIYPPLNHVVTS